MGLIPGDGSLVRQIDDVIGSKTDAASGAAGVALMALLRAAYDEAYEAEHHVHNRERWFGKSGDQSGSDWAADNLTPFRAISGNNAYGTDANDAALVLGTSDTPSISGRTKFDLHRLFISATSSNTPWKLRVIYGSGAMAAAITAGQYTEVMIAQDDTNPQQAVGSPVDIIMPRLACGSDKVWVQAWNGTDNATIDFFAGFHEYSA